MPEIINPFTDIPYATLSTPGNENSGSTFLSDLRELQVGQGGSNIFRADKDGIFLGGKTFALANFSVAMSGALKATSAEIDGKIVAGVGSDLPAGYITGSIVADQIGSVAADTITGTITAEQITSIDATQITGSIVSTQIGSVAATTITGSITADQITSIAATQITGSITSEQIGSVAATTITGAIVADQIGSINATVINGVIVTDQLADGIISALALFATDLRPISSVGTLPELPDANYPIGAVVYLTTDAKLYRNVANVWDASAAASDITGTLTASQIGSINSDQITGLILAGQISSIAATQITGAISADQIGSITIGQVTGQAVDTLPELPDVAYPIGSYVVLSTDGKLYRNAANVWTVAVAAGDLTGSITASQIGSVNASAITGSITSDQITSLVATKITGSITAEQITSIASTQITGSITSDQITSLVVGKLDGQISGSQITDLAVTADKIANLAITSAQIANLTITANQIANLTITSGKIASINADKINVGTLTGFTIQTAASDKRVRITSSPQNRIQFLDGNDEEGYLEMDDDGDGGYYLNLGGPGGLLQISSSLGASETVLVSMPFFAGAGKASSGFAVIYGSPNFETAVGLTWSGGGVGTFSLDLGDNLAEISSDLIPYAAGLDLGGSVAAEKWRNLYLSGSIVSGAITATGITKPSVTNTYDLGSSGYNWSYLYTNYCATNIRPINNTLNLGDATYYWNNVYYKTLVKSGGFGFLDRGVKLQDGKQVSDLEAITQLTEDRTKKTPYGSSIIDHKTLPEIVYRPARNSETGKLMLRGKDNRPYQYIVNDKTKKKEKVFAEDGEDVNAMISIMIGAIKGLNDKVESLKKEVDVK